MTNLLISVKPHWAEKIASGEKTWELRKVRPRDDVKNVAIYATALVSKITCIATLEIVASGLIKDIWRHLQIENHGCVTESDFFEYYQGKDKAYALALSNPQPLNIPLSEIRELKPNFHPPQSYIYLPDDDKLMEMIYKEVNTNSKT